MSKISVEADISSGKWNISDLDIDDMDWNRVDVSFYFIDDDSAQSGIVNIAGMVFGYELIHEGEVVHSMSYPPEGHQLLDLNIFATDNPVLEVATIPVAVFHASKMEKSQSPIQRTTVRASGICKRVQSLALPCSLLKCCPRKRNGIPAKTAVNIGRIAPHVPTPKVIS